MILWFRSCLGDQTCTLIGGFERKERIAYSNPHWLANERRELESTEIDAAARLSCNYGDGYNGNKGCGIMVDILNGDVAGSYGLQWVWFLA